MSPSAARLEFDTYYARVEDPSITHVVNADSAMLLSRDGWSCDAALALYPVPPVQHRTFAYRLFVPSVYADGQYTIELPRLDGFGKLPEIELAGSADPEFDVEVDQHALAAQGEQLAGYSAHSIVLRPRDAGRGRVRAVDLDVDALVRQSPAAQALVDPDTTTFSRTLELAFEAPAELAVMPPVRRAVVLIDGSRSITDAGRERLQRFAAAYFEALIEVDAAVEVVIFDREVQRVYHDFVPARWGAQDIAKLEIAGANGSEVGEAMAFARGLLAEPSAATGADWIVVLSDLDLRRDYDVAHEQALAAASAVRVHVVHTLPGSSFSPAAATEPWTLVARSAGGMAWDIDNSGTSPNFADELVSPRRIWKLEMELELADGGHESSTLDRWIAAGSLRKWYDDDFPGAALTRASFVGEVWGQRRAWTSVPDDLHGRRLAGALATHSNTDLSDAVLTALAFHAQVVSPHTSAWILAQFEGTAPAPTSVLGSTSCFGGGHSRSFGCGGAHSCHAGHSVSNIDFAMLAQEAVSRCRPSGTGSYAFETTDVEIVAVASDNRCLAEQTWATDIRPTYSVGRKQVTVHHTDGDVTKVDVVAG
jgi:hypothetical protein